MTYQSKEKKLIKEFSNRIIDAQKEIRILDAIKWRPETKKEFFKHRCKKLPQIDADYYRPLSYNPDEKIKEFKTIIRDVQNNLGQYSGISRIIVRLCDEYCKALAMLKARGSNDFSSIAIELYGAPDDVFYPGGPKLSELGSLLKDKLQIMELQLESDKDKKRFKARQAQQILQKKLSHYFHKHHQHVSVQVSDSIVADAAAGADKIRLNHNALFSERDLKYLEVHEGWVHVGTTLNGTMQPYCSFLSKGSPSCSVIQEGLAVITEVFTFSSSPMRMQKIINRVNALEMIRKGANFIDVYHYYQQCGYDEDTSYTYSMRAFRGSTADGGAFTKDLSYAKGFVLIYNFIRLAFSKGLLHRIPLLFVGKVLLEDIPVLDELHQQGLIHLPTYLPEQFKDLSALSAWMSFSLYLNQFDLGQFEKSFGLLLKS